VEYLSDTSGPAANRNALESETSFMSFHVAPASNEYCNKPDSAATVVIAIPFGL
jgi:hypothetical protein